jgi:hypothetical protein
VGQRLRVPAPTPTPTIQPSPSGSETPTPTATATFNAPNSSSPLNGAFFSSDELVTLRWIPTGVLGPSEAYRVDVHDVTSGQNYTDNTRELFYIIPREWQGKDRQRHTFRWTVSVISIDNPDNPTYTSEPLSFVWQGMGENEP